ncbi:MAG: hypothetical protein HY811_06330 [Planctomycetes bacterium]|nr:hypothetical protein [Planctomycetota bacterium]
MAEVVPPERASLASGGSSEQSAPSEREVSYVEPQIAQINGYTGFGDRGNLVYGVDDQAAGTAA